jgi:predicted dehydrogenase
MTLEQSLSSNHLHLRESEDHAQRERLRGLAVIGLGYWGPNWVRNIYHGNRVERLVCCDLDAKRRKHIQQLYPGVETTPYLDHVLHDPDIEALVVATPVGSHYRIARQALETGKSVVVEKPLATCVSEASHLVRLARENSRTLLVGHTFEYSAPVLKIKELISAGELGDIFYISSVRANLGLFQRDVNVAWDLGTHDVSIILMLTGRMPEAVSCQGQSHYCDGVEDVALITLYFPNKMIAFIHVSWLDPNKIRRTTIVGSRKMLVYDDTALQEKIRVYDKGVNVHRYYDTFGDFQYSYRYGDIYIPRLNETEPLRIESEHFIDCILGRSEPRTDGLNGLRVVTVLEAAGRSLRNGGKPVPVTVEGID